ncbi:MAG: DNA recombination protein RmuC [Oceanicaulis sp.]
MGGETIGFWILIGANVLIAAMLIAVLVRRSPEPKFPMGEFQETVTRAVEPIQRGAREDSGALRKELQDSAGAQRESLERKMDNLTDGNARQFKDLREIQSQQLEAFGKLMAERLDAMARQQDELKKTLADQGVALSERLDKKQASIQQQLDQKLRELREENGQKLEQMRQTVDEKLQSTLEKRLGESFKQVSERLETVHKGLGEMQALAGSVGDLKRTLTNVKTRGTWAEVQLGAIIEDMLTPDQFEQNAQIKKGSQERVEFAIRLPGRDEDGTPVLLAVDSKFPTEDYERLMQASERGDPVEVEAAASALEKRIVAFAKDISSKYISPPATPDFAIMYLPTEGLYAEIVRRPGVASRIQNEHRVAITGPSNFAAFLTTLQMGFRTLAIEKRSSEVWQVLGAVKTEFDRFGSVIGKVKKKLQEAGNHLDQVDTRTRVMNRKLKTVEALPDQDTVALLGPMEAEDSDHGLEPDEVGAPRPS